MPTAKLELAHQADKSAFICPCHLSSHVMQELMDQCAVGLIHSSYIILCCTYVCTLPVLCICVLLSVLCINICALYCVILWSEVVLYSQSHSDNSHVHAAAPRSACAVAQSCPQYHALYEYVYYCDPWVVISIHSKQIGNYFYYGMSSDLCST